MSTTFTYEGLICIGRDNNLATRLREFSIQQILAKRDPSIEKHFHIIDATYSNPTVRALHNAYSDLVYVLAAVSIAEGAPNWFPKSPDLSIDDRQVIMAYDHLLTNTDWWAYLSGALTKSRLPADPVKSPNVDLAALEKIDPNSQSGESS